VLARGLKNGVKKKWQWQFGGGRGSGGGGSGRVAVVGGSLERGDGGGQFGVGNVVVVAVLSELWAVARGFKIL
jgi:hypothetical protein